MEIAAQDLPALRREILACKDMLIDLAFRLEPIDPEAAASLRRARSATFEAWTILCGPPDDDDDH